MKVEFNREYLPMLVAFMATNDVRFYLCGFHVKPHPTDEGVILTATDGHRLVTIHDVNGLSDGEYIFPITKSLAAAGKKNTHPEMKKLPLTHVQINNGYVAVLNKDDQDVGMFNFTSGDDRKMVSHIEPISPIEGRYPCVSRVIKNLSPKPTEVVGFNVGYLGSLKPLLNSKHPIARMTLCGNESSAYIVAGFHEEIVAVVMPARIDDQCGVKIPDFAVYSGAEANEEENKEAA